MRIVLVLLLLGVACSKAPESQRLSATVPVCDPSVMTIEDGPLPPQGMPGTSDATATGRFVLSHAESCRLFQLRLLRADGELATNIGSIHGTFMRSFGIVRFPLPHGIASVGQADSAFTDSTIAAAYVVHGANGTYFLDVHLAGPAKASKRGERVPSLVELELATGGGAIPTLAPRARNVVVMEPRDGGVTYPIVIKGYARTFEANVQAWIEQGDSVVTTTRTHATAADWMTTWGEFELTIPRGPDGDIRLFVGEESAKDGTPIGVRIPLHAASGGVAQGR